MHIRTKVISEWNGTRYVSTHTEGYEYEGQVDLCCGATQGQNNALNQQTSLTQQMTQQGQQIFGNSSQVFNDLIGSLSPTVAAGPSQQGFSQAELSNLNSTAITQNGQSYQNEKAAVGNSMAAAGGGTSALPSGSTEGADLSLAENAGNQTASELSQIKQADYAQGQQNYNTAVSGLESATGVFNPATSAGSAASSAAEGEANTANQIATQNNSWIQGVTGALGGIAAGGMNGYLSGLSNPSVPVLNTGGASTLAPQVGGYPFPASGSGINEPPLPTIV
jgi:hypothetical protein